MKHEPGLVASEGNPIRWSWTVLSLGGLAVVVLSLIDPFNSPLLPPCIFHAMTGLYCPGCGSTRALYCLIHGDLGAAFRFNPLLLISLPFFAYAIGAPLAEHYLGLRRLRIELKASASWGILITILVYSVLRNLPIEHLSIVAR